MSFPMTDIIVGFFLFLLIANGAYQGFLRSAVGPASIMVASLAAWIIFITTKNIGATLLVGLLGPFILGWGFSFLFKLFLPKHETPVPSLISRVAGALLSVGWGAPILAGGIILLALIPIQHPTLISMREDISRSVAYAVMAPLVHLPDPRKTMNDEKQNQEAADDLTKDPRFQEMLQDPELLKAIEHKDFTKILSDPRIMALNMDPAFVMKALKAANKKSFFPTTSKTSYDDQ